MRWGSSEEAPDVCLSRRFLVLIFLRSVCASPALTQTETVLAEIQNRLLTPTLALPQNTGEGIKSRTTRKNAARWHLTGGA